MPGITTHPGELLRDEILPTLGWTRQHLADHLGVSRQTLQQVLAEKRSLSVDLALRLEAALGSSAEMWLRMQMDHDLAQARETRQDELAVIMRIEAVNQPEGEARKSA